jgi:adenosylhomocysteine nucleosidase
VSAGPATVGVVVGLAAEARIAARFADRVVAVGSAPGAAAEAARALIGEGVAGLVSFGLAGALTAELGAGDLVLGEAVHLPGDGGLIAADKPWLTRVAVRLPGVRRGTVAGATAPVATGAEKARLARRARAIICDMESHQVARMAQAAGVPFLVLRAVVDGLAVDLPAAARAPIKPGGRPDMGAIIRALIRDPQEIAELISLGFAARRGLAALLRGGAVLGRGFAFGDLG